MPLQTNLSVLPFSAGNSPHKVAGGSLVQLQLNFAAVVETFVSRSAVLKNNHKRDATTSGFTALLNSPCTWFAIRVLVSLSRHSGSQFFCQSSHVLSPPCNTLWSAFKFISLMLKDRAPNRLRFASRNSRRSRRRPARFSLTSWAIVLEVQEPSAGVDRVSPRHVHQQFYPLRCIVAVATASWSNRLRPGADMSRSGGAFGILIGFSGKIVDNETAKATCTSLTHVACSSICLTSALRTPAFSGRVRLAITRRMRLSFDMRARLSPRDNHDRSVRKSFPHYTRLSLPGLRLVQLAGNCYSRNQR